MKKIVVAIVMLTLLFSLLPASSALAGKAIGDVTISVKNHTGGNVTLTLSDQYGNRFVFNYEPGMFDSTVLEGRYSYYANTPCGIQTGSFNMNVNKHLDFFCNTDDDEISLRVPSSQAGLACEIMFWYSHHEAPGVRNFAPNYPKAGQQGIIEYGLGGLDCYDGVSPLDRLLGL
ncbi:MAG: hypothetical protein NTW32_17285 [Chloroflexi bacterium]|nr:hypothetical protein [Chloroflexota bacterium]